MMGLLYIDKLKYSNLFEYLTTNQIDFEVVKSGIKKHISRKIGKETSKFYYSQNPGKENAVKLLDHELGLISIIKRDALARYKKKPEPFKNRIGRNLYIGYKMRDGIEAETEDIWEVDINMAYPTTALRLGVMSDANYAKFSEIETNPTHIKRKNDIRRQFPQDGAQFFTKIDGVEVCLKYSKKCRLVALGTLAQKKEIEHYRAGKFSHKDTDYCEESANIFFSCAWEVGKSMYDIAEKTAGVYFWWVDAIFCSGAAVDDVVRQMKERGYTCKVKQLKFLKWDGRKMQAHIVKDDSGEFQPYFFARISRLSHHKTIMQKETELSSIIASYLGYMNDSDKIKKKVLEKIQMEWGQSATVEQMIFTEMKEALGITSPSDLNMKVLLYNLKARGLCYKDFVQIRTITKNITKDTYLEELFNDGDTLVTMRMLVEAFKVDKEYINGAKTPVYRPHPTIPGFQIVEQDIDYHTLNSIETNDIDLNNFF